MTHEFAKVIALNWEIICLFFIIAVLYSSVGFGGGSSYLAVLAVTALAFPQIRAISLLCNIVVVTGGTYIYIKNNLFNWKKIIPLAIASVPMAFLGGYLKISQSLFFILLSLTLLIAAFLMWTSNYISKKSEELLIQNSTKKDLTFGGSIGFLSGMVGIGGGIFLAPLLHLTKWDTPQKIAATSSFFILINSIAGLGGQYFNPNFSVEPVLTFLLMLTVLIGGQIGSRISIKFISPLLLKKATAFLIAFIAIRLLIKHLL
ncbi:sulfite exporter TauE/SafE family protein [Lutibacter sp.]|uniref:sulfite exporter TauE/SafE family protein n=1 Tax=Lutibacter sp. TaxID=1925666 RepID=UPI00273775E7|nr:sulfite exporter TauE/SafE family protein [Lutibacter sp.]MDP3312541.1 sulfite exporter TauE/SafE family protein [Lutibacter sp.]